jgi:hypothetical protein
MKLRDLNFEEQLSIYGGAPTTDTGFFYDVCWYIGAGAKYIARVSNPVSNTMW